MASTLEGVFEHVVRPAFLQASVGPVASARGSSTGHRGLSPPTSPGRDYWRSESVVAGKVMANPRVSGLCAAFAGSLSSSPAGQ